jgi:DNA-binding NtrC family response regulator
LSRAVVERLATFGEDRARFEERLTRAIALGPLHPPRSESERARRLAEAGEIGEALKLLPEARDAGSATLRAKLLWRAGRSEEALALLEGREESEARLLRAGIARERGLLDRAEEMVASGEKEEAGLWIELARLRWVRGHPEDGLRLLQETLGGGPSRLVEAEARGLMARILARLARLREASNEIQQAVSLLDPIEDEGQLRSLRVVRAEVDFRSGRWQSARQASSAEVDGSRRAGDQVVLQEALLLLAEIEIAMGQEGSAARTLDEAFALAVSRGDALSRLRALLLRLEALAAQGDWPAVRARARELSRFPALADCPWEGMRMRVFLTRAALETGFARPAREPLGEPAALFAELGDPVLAALYGCVQALALARAGQTEKASEVFERSVQPLEIMSLAHAQAHLYIDFATEPTFSRYEERVRLRRDAAERIARELGAAPLLRRLESESDRARPEVPRVPGLIASSPAMISALAQALRAARFNVPVHLSGESGTGKELVARAIHGHSPRAAASFVALNCAALPDALLEAELFGHTRGAFTGADRSRFGLLEQAQGGTLFLDEVADLSPRGQTLLLRVLQEKEYRRLGEAEPRRSDFRLISASHKPLEEEVAAGRFREDLYFRLKVVGVDLPPLRERAEDILPLAQSALSRKAAELGLTVPGLSRDAERVVLAHAWPGNVRELENEMVQALLRLGAAKTVGLEHLSARLGGAKPARLQRARRELERRLLEEALARHRGNRTRAAQELGLTRQALYQKIRQYGLGPAPSQAEWPIRASSSAVGNDSTRYLSG